MMEDRTGLIRVINHNEFTVDGRYAGKDYVFKPGVPLDVPEIVAWHVFDFGKQDKSQALNRLGWARTSEEYPKGMKFLDNITFEDPPEMIEAPTQSRKVKRVGQKTGTAGPPVTAGGTEGGDLKSPPDGPKIGEGADTF